MTTPPNQFLIPSLPNYVQQERNWCWAATCAVLNDYFSTSPDAQCLIANAVLQQDICCTDPGSCDEPWSVDAALTTVGHLNTFIEGSLESVPGGFGAIASQIGVYRRPVVVRIGLPDGGDHVVVIYGYDLDGSLVVWDPAGQIVHTSIAAWLTDLGDWLDTYFTQ